MRRPAKTLSFVVRESLERLRLAAWRDGVAPQTLDEAMEENKDSQSLAEIPVRYEIPAQGVVLEVKPDELIRFLERERNWYRGFRDSLKSGLVWQGQLLQQVDVTQASAQLFQRLTAEIQAGNYEGFQRYLADANAFRIVISSGIIGERIDGLKKVAADQAAWALLIYGGVLTNESTSQALAPLRASLFSNPSTEFAGRIEAVNEVHERTTDLEKRLEGQVQSLKEFAAGHTKVLTDLESLYRQQLPVRAPADFWKDAAFWKSVQWVLWLLVFCLLAGAPLIAAISYWDTVSAELTKLVPANNAFSIGALAIVSIPAILYGWVLKNVSRIFIQQMNLAHDASHRRALSMTWLGMVAEEKFALTKEERALVLNAIFRPIPPNSQDDGPPSGLMELLGKK